MRMHLTAHMWRYQAVIHRRLVTIRGEGHGSFEATLDAMTESSKRYEELYDASYKFLKEGEANAEVELAEIHRLAVSAPEESAAQPVYHIRDGSAVQCTSEQVQLYLQAAEVRPRVTKMMLDKFGGSGRFKSCASIKRNVRIAEKALLRAPPHEGEVDRCLDLVRDMYVATEVREVREVVAAMCEWSAVQIVRIKDRFHEPSAGGWRDCMINYVCRDDPYAHICELQVSHTAMVATREGMHAHAVYNHTRNAPELVERREDEDRLSKQED